MTGSLLPRADGPSVVRSHAIAALTAAQRPTPTDRQLRRWMQEGTVPNVTSVSGVTEKLLNHISEASTLLGRGKDRADRVRVVLAVRGHDIATDVLRADAMSSLLDFGGVTATTNYDFNDPHAIDQVSDLVASMIADWSNVRGDQRLRPLVTVVNAVGLDGGDGEPDETVRTKCRMLVHNIVSSALGEGVYEPKPLADAIVALLEWPDDEKAALGRRLEAVLKPGWNQLVETVRTGSIDRIISIARALRSMGAGEQAVQIVGGKAARNHPTHADYMCFVSAIYHYMTPA